MYFLEEPSTHLLGFSPVTSPQNLPRTSPGPLTMMQVLQQRDVYCQMTILLPSKMVAINKFTPQAYYEPPRNVQKDRTLANVMFIIVVIVTLTLIAFTMWLSVMVRGRQPRYWTLGKIAALV